MAVGRNVKCSVVVEELEDVRSRGGIDDGGGDELIHRLMVGWFCRIMNETCAAAVHRTRKESHSKRLLMSDALEGSDQISTFKVLDGYM